MLANDGSPGPTSTGYWLTGDVDGRVPGSLSLAVNGDLVAGTVTGPSGAYSIRTASNGLLLIQQIDLSTLPWHGRPPVTPEAPPRPASDRIQPIVWDAADVVAERMAADARVTEDGSRIDVLVVYDETSRTELGGHAELKVLIDVAVAGTNHALAKSGVVQRIHLTDVREVTSRPDDTYDSIVDLRNRTAADIVFRVYPQEPDFCGYAFISILASVEGRVEADPGFAHAAISTDCLKYRGASVSAHELGHVMGLWHDRYVVGDFVTRANQCRGRPCVSFKPYTGRGETAP